MIFVGGLPFSCRYPENENVVSLLENPVLVTSSNSFKATPVKKVSHSQQADLKKTAYVKHVYVFQREFATVDPKLVKYVGTDEVTTCVGVAIRNRESGMISVAHMDSPRIVEFGLTQMLSLLVDPDVDAILDVAHQEASQFGSHERRGGYSLPLISKIVEVLVISARKFHLQTFCVLGHNTIRDSGGNTNPIINGFLVETFGGAVIPAAFDRNSRCPDELVRRIRVSVSSLDPQWKGKLLETYDTHHDKFQIAPCSWSRKWQDYALTLQQYSDLEVLHECSTSPSAEGPDFVENERRVFNYLIKFPDWIETFPKNMPRIFERVSDGGWIRCN
ncbi:protein N-terminal asparagine amidohydrolase isoform X2 [Aristolochia californica]|uniref:protein N-terminal asparagine amidohydrolase isoform X2 n=1 Tax=Aristolochia californica TaxID=171875 RepID=UPI0035DD1468